MTELRVVDSNGKALAKTETKDPFEVLLRDHSLTSPILSKKALAKIEQRMPEISRASQTAGRQNTQVTSQLMTLNMSGDEPYRHLRQILAQIEKKRSALEEAHFRVKKQALRLRKLEDKIAKNPDDEMALINRDEILLGFEKQKIYIQGAIKEIGMFQDAYEDIRESNGIPEEWDEVLSERAEVRHHIKMGFRNGFQEIMSSGMVGRGTAEYLEQFGIHPQMARKLLHDYVTQNEERISQGAEPDVTHFHRFLDNMANKFSDAYEHSLKRIGLKELVREDWCYTTDASIKEITDGK